MKKSFDKEALIKNRFWIGLGASVLFVLIAFFMVLGVRGDSAKLQGEAKRVDEQLKGIINKKDLLRNDKWIARMKEETQKAEKQKEEVWYGQFDMQVSAQREPPPKSAAAASPGPVSVTTEPPKVQRGKIIAIRNPFIIWPSDVQDHIVDVGSSRLAMRDLDYGWKIGIVPTDYKLIYPKQFDDFVNDIKNLELLDEKKQTGSLRIAGNAPTQSENLLRLLRPHPLTKWPVHSDEAWILQEDFGLKRDMVRAIVDTNKTLAQLKPEWRQITIPDEPKDEVVTEGAGAAPSPPPAAEKSADKDQPAGTLLDHKRFYNTTWLSEVAKSAAKKEEKQPEGEPEKQAPKLPKHLSWWEGWQIDLVLTNLNGNITLKGTAINHSHAVTTPAGKLAVYFTDAADKELPTPVYLEEASNMPPSQAKQNQLSHSKRDLKPLAAPKEAKKIARIQRVAVQPITDHQRFFNNTWLVNVRLVAGQGGVGAAIEGEMFNRSGRMTLPAAFEVTFNDGREDFSEFFLKVPKAEALKAGETKEFARVEVRRAQPPKRIVSIRQVLDWRSVPVKQINRIEFYDVAHNASDRTRIRTPLRRYDFKRKDPSAVAEAPPAAADTTGGTTGGAAPGVASPGGAGGSSARAGDAKTPDHGISLNRYYEVTDEVRRVPVAVVLVVDATYMNDVLASLANSRLRIQITQAVWNRMPAGLPKPNFQNKGGAPAAGGTGPLSDGAAGPLGAAGGGGKGGSVGLPGYPGGPAGPSGIGGTGPGSRGPISVEEDTNEIELQVYGLISIYENPDAAKRFEEIKQKSAAAATASAPTETPAKPQ